MKIGNFVLFERENSHYCTKEDLELAIVSVKQDINFVNNRINEQLHRDALAGARETRAELNMPTDPVAIDAMATQLAGTLNMPPEKVKALLDMANTPMGAKLLNRLMRAAGI